VTRSRKAARVHAGALPRETPVKGSPK